MRNTTMLKAILMKYSIHLEMDDNEHFTMKLTDKQTHAYNFLSASSYSGIIRKAYSFLMQDLKNIELKK